jgi:hypothetical protein
MMACFLLPENSIIVYALLYNNFLLYFLFSVAYTMTISTAIFKTFSMTFAAGLLGFLLSNINFATAATTEALNESNLFTLPAQNLLVHKYRLFGASDGL